MALTPATREELSERLAAAAADRRTLAVRGGGAHGPRGRPVAVDDELSTAGLDRVLDHAPEDLTVTVEGGVTAADLVARLDAAGQCWPQGDAAPGATVGGILAAAASDRARLRFGPVRDSLLRVVLCTGDGRLVAGGGRTVKGVSGYDLPRMAVGSLGTLGVIVEATLKLWPRPAARAWFAADGTPEDLLTRSEDLRREIHAPAALIVGPDRLWLELAGAPDEVAPPAGFAAADPPGRPEGAGRVECGVPPPRLPALARALDAAGRPFEAWIGTGVCRVGVEDSAQVEGVRAMARAEGGHAQVIDGPDELRRDPFGPPPPGLAIMHRLRFAFDPAGVLNPGCVVGDAA